MSYFPGSGNPVSNVFGNVQAEYEDNISALYDSFGRQRVSEPLTLATYSCVHSDASDDFRTTLTGGGTTTFLPNESCVVLNVGTSNGDSARRRTYEYHMYYPGKSMLVELTGVLAPSKANVVSKIGYYDDFDGVYFQSSVTGISIVLRSYTTGSVVETVIPRSSWNLDKLDGNGPSKFNIDFSKFQIFVVDLQWLGGGQQRFGVYWHGKIIYFHVIQTENTLSSVYMRSASLPITYEIINTGPTPSPTSMKQICSTVVSEGGNFTKGKMFSHTTLTNINTPSGSYTPLITISSPVTLDNGLPNRTRLQVDAVTVICTSTNSPLLYTVHRGAVISTSNFTNINTYSTSKVDTSATTMSSPGTVVFSDFASIGRSAAATKYENLYVLPGETVTVSGRGVGGTSSAVISINWREVR